MLRAASYLVARSIKVPASLFLVSDNEAEVQVTETNRWKLEWLGVPLSMFVAHVIARVMMLVSKIALNSLLVTPSGSVYWSDMYH
jgi:hypothetical protein